VRQLRAARRAITLLLLIDQSDVRGEAHYTFGFSAVSQSEGVAQLVEHFFDDALVKYEFIRRQAIEFLAQTGEGNDGDLAVELRLTEHEGECGDGEVTFGDANDASGIGRRDLGERFRGRGCSLRSQNDMFIFVWRQATVAVCNKSEAAFSG
jgi:hypothetical protein